MRITIITFAWPPRNSIGAHRPYSWAKHWANWGATVRVLTARKYAYDEPLDLRLPALPGVEVIETDYARGVSRLAQQTFRGPLKKPARWLYRRLRSGALAITNPRSGWLDAIRPQIEDLALDSDYVVSTYDPRTVHEIAALMKEANPLLFWVADYRDLWSLNHAAVWTPAQRAAEATLEGATVGARADLVTSVSDHLAGAQGDFVRKPWLTVTNGHDVSLGTLRSRLRPLAKPSIPARIVYTGKIYPGLRDPAPLLEEILAMEKEGLISPGSVCVEVYGGQVEGLGRILRSGRYHHFLRLHGHVTRDTAMHAQQNADLLLLLESARPDAKGVVPGKIFEYMSTGVPILSLGSRRDSAIGDLLASTRTGFVTQDERALIRTALLNRLAGSIPGWFEPHLDAIAGYSREAQARRLLQAMTEARGLANRGE